MKNEGQFIPLPANKCGRSNEASDLCLPSMAYFELTPICNNNCVGCPNAAFLSNLNPRQIKAEYQCNYLGGMQWKSIISKLSGTVSAVNLTGGETTLHPEFEEIVQHLDDCQIDFVVFTNGRWRRPTQLISLLRSLRHFRGFLLSLHGASASTHELFTGVQGSFDEALMNACLALEHGLWVSISTVITKANCNEIQKVVQLAADIEANEISFNRFLTHHKSEEIDSSSSSMCPSPAELRASMIIIEELKHRYHDIIQISYGPCIPQCFIESSATGCSAGETFFVVDPRGNVKPCTDTALICGNILTESIQGIWHSKGMEYWRNLSNSTCNSCSMLSVCKTGCKAMALASGLQRDPLMVQTDQFVPLLVINPE